MSLYYKLLGTLAVPCTDVHEWMAWMESGGHRQRLLRQDTLGCYFVSTVFLGVDHSFVRNGPPILFETMIFFQPGRMKERYCERYALWSDALSGHEYALAKVRQWERQLPMVIT